MSNLSEKANYLKGLADGLQLNTEKSSNRLLLEVLDLLTDMAEEIESLRADHDELSDFVDAVDEDLSQIEEDVADLAEQPCPRHKPCRRFDDEEDDDEDTDEDFGDEDEVTYNCPHCGEEVSLDIEGFDFDEDMPCPHCGKPLFPESEDEDEAPEDEEDDEEDEDEDEDDLPGEDEE